jgi:hypothetical protein
MTKRNVFAPRSFMDNHTTAEEGRRQFLVRALKISTAAMLATNVTVDAVWGQGQGTPRAPGQKATSQVLAVTLTEEQKVDVHSTDLTIVVRRVTDFTSQGCLGGPVGCPDHVELDVMRGEESQQIVLYLAHTEAQRTQGIHQASVFGYHIALTALHGRQVTLSIEKKR